MYHPLFFNFQENKLHSVTNLSKSFELRGVWVVSLE